MLTWFQTHANWRPNAPLSACLQVEAEVSHAISLIVVSYEYFFRPEQAVCAVTLVTMVSFLEDLGDAGYKKEIENKKR